MWRQGADPNVVIEDAGNRTALHMAAYDAHVEAFRTAKGVDGGVGFSMVL